MPWPLPTSGLKWMGTAALVDRIRPVLLILGLPDEGLGPKSTDAARLAALLEPEIGQPAADELVAAALESDNDFEMGFRACRILGEAAELPRWNAALIDLGRDYGPVRNEHASDQAERHLYEAGRPLRAFARHVATGDASVSVDEQARLFAELTAAFERLDGDEEWYRRCREWTDRWWRVPFAEVLGFVRSRYEKTAEVEPHVRLLDGVNTISQLKEVLRTGGVSLNPDPRDVAWTNQFRLNRTVRGVWDVYRAWLGREKADSVPSGRAPDFGLEDEMYLREMPEDDLFGLAKNEIDDGEFLKATTGCGTVEELREKLGITDEDLMPVLEADEQEKREEEAARRTHVIAGKRFVVVGPETYRPIYEHLVKLPEPPHGPEVHDLD